MGPHLITLDCDVLDADGGTRAAALSGSCIALYDALDSLVNESRITANPFRNLVAGVSVVAVKDRLVLDPSYSDDARASMELNIALSETGEPVEIHAMGEGKPFSIRMLEEAVDLARGGAELIFEEQRRVLQETRADNP
jgi:ribonuclease PH